MPTMLIEKMSESSEESSFSCFGENAQANVRPFAHWEASYCKRRTALLPPAREPEILGKYQQPVTMKHVSYFINYTENQLLKYTLWSLKKKRKENECICKPITASSGRGKLLLERKAWSWGKCLTYICANNISVYNPRLLTKPRKEAI